MQQFAGLRPGQDKGSSEEADMYIGGGIVLLILIIIVIVLLLR
jgi:hypothetical protein